MAAAAAANCSLETRTDGYFDTARSTASCKLTERGDVLVWAMMGAVAHTSATTSVPGCINHHCIKPCSDDRFHARWPERISPRDEHVQSRTPPQYARVHLRA